MRNPSVKIRIMGNPETVKEIVNGIQIDENRFYKSVSRPYLNRRDSDVRVYVTITAAVQAESKKYTKARIEGNEDT